jgi:diguanylate cyclase (GGDEF)-like protein
LVAVSSVCLVVVLMWMLATTPILAVLLIPPVALLFRSEAQLAQWRRAATTDAATGLLNAFGWRQRAAQVLGVGSAEPGGGTAVLVVDFDEFKRVNDRYGHLSGDAVITAVGHAVAGAVRAQDAAGRLGGDEFVVAMRGVTLVELARVAERIRLSVAALRVPVPGGAVMRDGSVSVGAAHCPRGAATVPTLLAAADLALYEAKAAGRNTTRLSVVRSGSESGGGAGEPAVLPG